PWSGAVEEADGPTRHPLSASDGAESLGALALHGHVGADHGGERLLHGVTMRRQLRRLEHDRAVDVGDDPPGVAHPRHHRGEEREAVGAAPGGIGVGEVHADVAEPGGPEERVGHRMGHDVGIAVAGQPTFAFEAHAAQHQRTVVVGEGMDIEAYTDATRHARTLASRSRSARLVTFTLSGSPGTTTTVPPADSTSAASSVPSPPVACAARSADARNAWGVWTATSSVRSSVSTTRPSWTRLTVSLSGKAGTAPSAPDRTAAITAPKSAADAAGRAASCTTTTVASAGTRARPARTEAERVAPPTTTASARSSSVACSGATTSTTPSVAAFAAASDQSRTRRSPSGSYCLSAPKRSPRPAATTTAHTGPSGSIAPHCTSASTIAPCSMPPSSPKSTCSG